MSLPAIRTRCCIAGGGPAGMMLGLLLARAGVEVVVLETHCDFLRDFRGDTLHPSTLQVLAELGMDERLLALPHQKVTTLSAGFGDRDYPVADFSRLPVDHPYIVLMPQWDFLDFLAREARAFPAFSLRMNATARGLVETDGRIVGVRAETPDGPLEIGADLVVDASGRKSTLRDAAGLAIESLGAPIDVFWFRLSHRDGDGTETAGRFDAGRLLVRIHRGDYWQCALVIPKGGAATIRARGIDAFRAGIAPLVPGGEQRALEIASLDDVKLLSVAVDRLPRWHRPGFLAIGDAAHAMSPVGGVGINLAIQDAVAAANLLVRPLRDGRLAERDLEAVQRRRMFPTRVTQAAQVFVHERILSPVLREARGGPRPVRPPLPVRLLARFALLRGLPARLVGLGIRPEHVDRAAAAVVRAAGT
jgi:2-polyprenyl-6-methoxyphenol hydroxylase-like FAD-dependent oxidoreductase